MEVTISAVDQVVALGPDKTYCAFDGNVAEQIVSRLSDEGRVYLLRTPHAGVVESLADPRCVCDRTSLPEIAGALIDLRSLPRQLQEDAGIVSLPTAVSEWLQTVTVPELGWVIDSYGVLYDAALAERIAEFIIQKQRVLGQLSTEDIADILEILRPEFQEERPNLRLTWILRALSVFVDGEMKWLKRTMTKIFEKLTIGGRCVIVTQHKWELQMVRDFLRLHEAPTSCTLRDLPPARLAELYPVLSGDVDFSVRYAAPPASLRHRTVHVLEKIALPDGTRRVNGHSSESPTSRFEEPHAPLFAATTCEIHDVTAELTHSEKAELKELEAKIVNRKAQLRSSGVALKQLKKDPQLLEWVSVATKMHCRGPDFDRWRQARCVDRTHKPVMLSETVAALMVCGPDGLYIDCTFGRGGHSEAILSELSERGRLLAFDVDPSAVLAAEKIKDSRFSIVNRPFGDLATVVREPVAGVLLDTGVSSPQLDDHSRGFSFRNKKDGPLDLRMNPTVGKPASKWLKTASVSQLAWVINACGHSLEPLLSERVAEAILQRQREVGEYGSTHQLSAVLGEIEVEFKDEHPWLSLSQIVFSALRVFLNHEMDQLGRALEGSFQQLEVGGRCVVLTFNKWEVVALRKFVRQHEEPSGAMEGVAPGRLAELYPLLSSRKNYAVRRARAAVAPAPEELLANPRSRVALLHVLEKVERRSAVTCALGQGSPAARFQKPSCLMP